jgi:BirA family biotin operon repressor/biotin-[acetyl-CoA-carboxylase] ligase
LSGAILTRSKASAIEQFASMLIERLPIVTSTNTVALERVGTDALLPDWILADEQTFGRGRHGRNWRSPPGNLYVTRLILSCVPIEYLSGLAFVAALSIHDVVSSILDDKMTPLVRLKWPNDLLVDGKKLSGVLIETENVGVKRAIAVGMGVNICSCPSDGATCINALASTATRDELFASLAIAFERWRTRWDEGNGFGDIRIAWLKRGPPLGAPVTVRCSDAIKSGRFAGLASDGALLLELGNGRTVHIAAGEVLAEGDAR